MRLALGLVLTASLTASFAAPAKAVGPDRAEGHADAEELPKGGAEMVSETSVGAEGEGSGGGPGDATAGEVESSEGAPTHYLRIVDEDCPRADDVAVQLVDAETGDPVGHPRCVPDGEVPGDEPPPPPTLEEIRTLAIERIDVPEVHTNPYPEHGGITGLENWFWYEGPMEVTVETSIRGYATTATMTPSRFYWEPCAHFEPSTDGQSGEPLGCPALLESTESGREPDHDSDGRAAAATFMYETKGHYVIRHQVVWDGTWEFAGHGASAAGTLPTVRATGETAYKVDEIRSTLVHPRATE